MKWNDCAFIFVFGKKNVILIFCAMYCAGLFHSFCFSLRWRRWSSIAAGSHGGFCSVRGIRFYGCHKFSGGLPAVDMLFEGEGAEGPTDMLLKWYVAKAH